MEFLHELLLQIVNASILLLEFIGVIVIILSGISGFFQYIKHNPFTRLNLAKGLAMGLEFKLGSEILRTVVVRDWNEIITVGAIILLRASLSLFIHWEIKTEEQHHIPEQNHSELEKKTSNGNE
ncbi:DUF1622 domain-containing protein [Massilioclostridium coli]|uniref:DUF1622 domain-containing protein n=1 Tax=Massilioclostridium coli TaxID=1870991 RepID=UPI00085C3436|nr:DUF1622 domain-containing protein [Massilioclostridium coli]